MIKIVEISFNGNLSKTYDFYTDFYTLEKGDTVVCETSRGASVGKVVAIKEFGFRSPECCKWVVQKILEPNNIAKAKRLQLIQDAELEEILG